MITIKRFYKFKEYLLKNTGALEFKNESKFMKFLAFLLFYNKTFMKYSIITIGKTIYLPSREFLEKYPSVSLFSLAHEFMHVCDSTRLGLFVYLILYFSPQILSIFSLLSILALININFLYFLLFLIFLFPIPSPGRKYIELRGFKMNFFIRYLYLKEFNLSNNEIRKILLSTLDYYDRNFTSSIYYFMWPLGIKDEIIAYVDGIINGKISNDVERKIKLAFYNSRQ